MSEAEKIATIRRHLHSAVMDVLPGTNIGRACADAIELSLALSGLVGFVVPVRFTHNDTSVQVGPYDDADASQARWMEQRRSAHRD